MRRLWPRSLAGQLIVLLLLALFAAQAICLLIFADERRLALLDASREDVVSRTAAIVRLLTETPPELHQRMLAAASTGGLHFWLTSTRVVDPALAEHRDHRLALRLRRELGWDDSAPVLVDVRGGGALWDRYRSAWRAEQAHPLAAAADDDDDDEAEQRQHRDDAERHGDDRRPLLGLVVAVGLGDGRWLNAETLVPPPSPAWAAPSLVAMAAMAIAVCAITLLVVRRLTRPLERLAAAADAVGRGAEVPPLAEVGPQEIERTTRAFNRMQERLRRFVDDRTQMLAAVSHDLRTPLTSLRLRAEFVEDEETRRKILETLGEMQRMIEATLAFAREDAGREATRMIDLAALVESIAADLADVARRSASRAPAAWLTPVGP